VIKLAIHSVVQFLVMFDLIENPFQRVSFFLSIAHAKIFPVPVVNFSIMN
jgi:hypothetical protein